MRDENNNKKRSFGRVGVVTGKSRDNHENGDWVPEACGTQQKCSLIIGRRNESGGGEAGRVRSQLRVGTSIVELRFPFLCNFVCFDIWYLVRLWEVLTGD